MKTFLTSLTTLLMAAALFLSVGCKKEGTDTAAVETEKMSSAFSTADTDTKTQADEVIAAAKSADYSGALAKVQALAANAKLTPEQKQALKDIMAQIQAKLTAGVQDATKAAKDTADKTVNELQKSIGK